MCGKQLTRSGPLGIRGVHNGLRVTDATRMSVMVLAAWSTSMGGELERGQRALGICGGDAGLMVARKLTGRSKGQRKDLDSWAAGESQRRDSGNGLARLAVVASLGLGPAAST